MAIHVQPVDGLIYRLLQQNNKPSRADVSAQSSAVKDQLQISAQARDGQPMHSVEAHIHAGNPGQERSLESHLLKLYKSNDLLGG